MYKCVCIFVLVFGFHLVNAQECEQKENVFQIGERIDYNIYYHLAGLWVGAGEVYFKVDSQKIANRTFFHFDSYGKTFKKYDWIYKVRDHYEAISEVETLKPIRFKRAVNEGSTFIREDYLFNNRRNQLLSNTQVGEDAKIKKDTIELQDCTFDVLSMIYYARNIDYSKYKKEDKIPIRIAIDGAVHDSYIRYLGKRVVNVKGYGKFRCIEISPYLIEGTIFNGGEEMTVLVTDDKNRIPVSIETPILVGSIRVRLNEVVGLKHPMDALIIEP